MPALMPPPLAIPPPTPQTTRNSGTQPSGQTLTTGQTRIRWSNASPPSGRASSGPWLPLRPTKAAPDPRASPQSCSRTAPYTHPCPRERDLSRRVGVGPLLQQQPHDRLVAVMGSLDEARGPVLEEGGRGGGGGYGLVSRAAASRVTALDTQRRTLRRMR